MVRAAEGRIYVASRFYDLFKALQTHDVKFAQCCQHDYKAVVAWFEKKYAKRGRYSQDRTVLRDCFMDLACNADERLWIDGLHFCVAQISGLLNGKDQSTSHYRDLNRYGQAAGEVPRPLGQGACARAGQGADR
jgi:hypothetical protein